MLLPEFFDERSHRLVNADLGGDFAGLERPILVGSEKPEDTVREFENRTH